MECWDLLTDRQRGRMKPSERDKLTQETHQALLGIPGTEDKGLVGDFKELKEVVKEQNIQIDRNRVDINTLGTKQDERNKPSKKSIAGFATGGLAIVVALIRSFMGS